MKKNIYIICGGPGSEHEVSLKSSKSILTAINKKDFTVNKVFLNKNGNWYLNNKLKDFESILKKMKNGYAWPIIHGEFGEDGKLQSLLEKHKILFFGSDSKTSKITIDKYKTQKKLEKHKITFPKSKIIKKVTDKIDLNFPIIVKPVNEGSSVGLFKIKDLSSYKKSIGGILKKFDQVLAQEFISGREFTCGVVNLKSKLTPLLPSEIVLTKTDVFNYKAKYKKGNCIEVTPAIISSDTTRKIQAMAIKTHTILKCKDISRTDMILTNKNKIYVLEINTVPGMTRASFIPEQLKAMGISLSDYVSSVLGKVFKAK